MKKKFSFLILILALCFCACSKEKEVPPYQKNLQSTYIMPKPVSLTDAERDWLKARREEYKNAIKGQ